MVRYGDKIIIPGYRPDPRQAIETEVPNNMSPTNIGLVGTYLTEPVPFVVDETPVGNKTDSRKETR